MVDFFNMVPVKSNWKVLEGTLPSLKARAEIIGKNPLKLEAEGNVEGLKAETEGLIIDGVKGNFKGNQEEINLIAFTGNAEIRYDSITVGNEVRKNIVYITICRRIFAKYVKFVNCYFLKMAGNSI